MLRRCVSFAHCGIRMQKLYRIRFHTNSSKILCSRFDKDLPNPALPTPLKKDYKHDTDILLDQIRKAKSADRILELAASHLDVMNGQHIVTCLQNMHDVVKNNEINSKSLIDDKLFQALCSRLMKIVRLLDADELITVYKVLNLIGIPNNTYVMQSVLKMIGGHLNDLSIPQLTFLNFLLSKQRHNAMVDGLRLAIPLVLQVQIEQQLDSDNMAQVVNCLQMACKSRLKPATIQKVVQTLSDKAKYLSPSNAVTVIFSLLNLETPVDGYKELINYAFEIVTKNLELINPQHIVPLLRVCCSQQFFPEAFLYEVSKKVVAERWNLESTWNVIRQLKKIGFCTQELVDHLGHVLCEESESFVSSALYSPLTCVEFLTMTGSRPPSLDRVLRIVCSAEEKIAALDEFTLLTVKFASCLAMLGHFPETLFSKVVSEEFLFRTWHKSRKAGRSHHFEQSALSLLWSLKVFNKLGEFPFPQAIVKNLTQVMREDSSTLQYPLQKCIENGLGGSQFLQNGVITTDGLFIDHVLAMRSGNYPVSISASDAPFSSGVIFVDDLALPPDAKIVSVIVAYSDQYCKSPEVLTGWMDMKIKCLENHKLYPVVINFSTWNALPDREKIPYLMREIKQAVHIDSSEKIDTLF